MTELGAWGLGRRSVNVRRESRSVPELLALDVAVKGMRVLVAARRVRVLLRKSNFDPNQPRIPRGSSDGGRRTDGGGSPAKRTGQPVRLAQARGGRGGPVLTLRLPAGTTQLSPFQAARYDAARIRAEIETARVRRVDPNWKPPSGLYQTVEGAIRDQQAIADAAIAHRYGRIGHNSGSVPPLRSGDTEPFVPGTAQTFAPNGVPLGVRYSRARPNVLTLDQNAFDNLLADALRGGKPISTPASYKDGYWLELSDRCVAGVRWSDDSGLTVDIIRNSNPFLLPPGTKFHRESGK